MLLGSRFAIHAGQIAEEMTNGVSLATVNLDSLFAPQHGSDPAQDLYQ